MHKVLRYFLLYLLHFVKKMILKCQSILGATRWSDAKCHESIIGLTWVWQFTPAEIEATSRNVPGMPCCPISATSRHCTGMSLCTQVCGMRWICLRVNLRVQGGTARGEQPLGKLALKVCIGIIERGGLRVEERMVKASSRDAGSHTVRQRTLQKDEMKTPVWYLFSIHSNLKEEIPMNCSNCVSYLVSGYRYKTIIKCSLSEDKSCRNLRVKLIIKWKFCSDGAF